MASAGDGANRQTVVAVVVVVPVRVVRVEVQVVGVVRVRRILRGRPVVAVVAGVVEVVIPTVARRRKEHQALLRLSADTDMGKNPLIFRRGSHPISSTFPHHYDMARPTAY